MLKLKTLPLHLFILFILLIPIFSSAQITTSGMSGTVKNASGEPLVGATITAIHLPTGTKYQVASRNSGVFDIFNMNPGGPYSIVVTYVGYDSTTKDDVFLNLGENSTQNTVLASKGTVLNEVVVATSRRGTTGKGGGETNIGRDKVANLPSVGRNLSDLIRFTPQVKITSGGGFSMAGQNNRYNSFMIDGAVNNDVFGLSEQGTNGGRAGAPPISLDAIDQITVQLSPFDVSMGNFTGGGINAITRSGTNEITGSLYYIFRNQELAGRAPIPTLKPGSTTEYERTKLSKFENKTFGFRVGGPIIKNKLFYFINYEKQDDSRPQPYDPTYRGNYIKNDSLNVLINYLKNTYSYDPGEYQNNPDLIQADRLATRFDWNINDKNQLIISYRYTKLARTNPGRSTNTTLNFTNNAEYYPSSTHSGSAELNSKISNTASNKLRLTITKVEDDRGITGSPFPAITFRDGGSSTLINMGSEISSAANLLKQDIINIYDAVKITKGIHTFSAGPDIDINKTYNLFMNRNYGFYEYGSIGEFMKSVSPLRYRRGYSLVDPGKSGDNSVNAAAKFNSVRLGFFVGDDIKVSQNFTVTAGIRADKTKFLDDPIEDHFFNDTAIAKISPFYDMKGARSGQIFKPSWLFSPRVGLRYNIPEENMTIRGGIGLFAGRIPLVWPGGGFQNTGVTSGAMDQRRSVSGVDLPITFPSGDPVPFRADVDKQYTATDFGSTNVTPQGELNIVAEKFKLPQVMRTSLAFDKRLDKGWTFTIEGIFTKNIHEVHWKNLLFDPTAVKTTTGPDVRTVYDPALVPNLIKIPLRPQLAAAQRNPYTSIILIQNSEDNKGYSYNFSLTVDKAFSNGYAFNANYVYGRSMVRNEATSSINSSNWNNMEAIENRNKIPLTISDFDLGHRITAYASKKFEYANKKLATTITLDYIGQTGSPYSFTMSGNIIGDGITFNDQMYVPTTADLKNMVFLSNTVSGVTYTPDQQKALFDTYIQNDKYLSKTRGKFAERNGARLPFTNLLNLKIQQDFNVKILNKQYQLQVTYDVFNFTNMLNKDWGIQYFANFDQVQLIQFAGFQTGTVTPTYRYLVPTTANGKPYAISDGLSTFNSSRWTSQLGLRINF